MGVDTEPIAPKELVLPTNATQGEIVKTGTIKISGATLTFFDGTVWKVVSTA